LFNPDAATYGGGNHALHYESICLGLPVGTPARVCLENPVPEGQPGFSPRVGAVPVQFIRLPRQRGRAAKPHGEAEHACGSRIDDQFELARLYDRQVGGLGALEDSAGINPYLTIRIRNVGSVADQPVAS
jgi:hypothetical protein